MVIDGIAVFLFGTLPVTVDVVRHSFAIGFITLLICGVAVRILPGFSSKAIRSPPARHSNNSYWEILPHSCESAHWY